MGWSGERVIVSEEFAARLGADDVFDAVMNVEGEVFRRARGRRTVRFVLDEQAYFAKIHTGVGWGEIAKNLLYLRLPVVSAATEWRASLRLRELGIRVPRVVAFGVRGRDPSRLRSFIVTEAITEAMSLEDLARHWQSVPAAAELKRAIINELAHIARVLHESGINHRDFYLGHFLIDRSAVLAPGENAFRGLHLLDLHRVQMRRRTPRRWRVKDLAGLLFSSMDAPITRRDVLRFASRYRGVSVRTTLREDAPLWRSVQRVAGRVYRRDHGRWPEGEIASLGCVERSGAG